MYSKHSIGSEPEGLGAITTGWIGGFNRYVQLLASHWPEGFFNEERETARRFYLPGHLFFLTRHSLTSEISGQGLPNGDGYCRTCLVRVSWPRLKPQVLPDREQGLHSLHSPTSQCTNRGNAERERWQWGLSWSLFLKHKVYSFI